MNDSKRKITRHRILLIANILLNIPVLLMIFLWIWLFRAVSNAPLTGQCGLLFPFLILMITTPCLIPFMIAQIITSIFLFRNPLSKRKDKVIGIITLVICGIMVVPVIIFTIIIVPHCFI